jgi:dTDP-4-amino-4,6-dideoxygalactose transaminase
MSKVPFVDLRAQYASIKPEIDRAIARVIENCHFILGPDVEAFEAALASWCGVTHAVGVNSGTSALHLALLAAGVKPGDEVITVSYTFVATAAAILYCGATPVYVDIDPASCTMDSARLEAAITPRTRVIMPVHLYGQCADMDPILSIARRHKLVVIEDAAQAHGATYRGRPAGSMGDLACFSFYPGKNLGAYGEGGAVVTNRDEWAAEMRVLRDQGQSRKYHHTRVGYNYRLEGLQGAVLGVKLTHLDRWNAARRDHAAAYRRVLAGSPVRVLSDMSWGTGVVHVFPVFTPERDALQAHLTAAGIATGIHYPIPVHLQPAFADPRYPAGSLPHTELAARQTLSLPMFAELTRDHIATVADAITRFTPSSSRT